ncbi:MAG TPA: Gfo/Idh/MocA family oxidoreductase [Bryobacteraceae bacterium]|nr:Gfo/Idh/MocA family oxidoreductase [Bryobacteraceae bacterium]
MHPNRRAFLRAAGSAAIATAAAPILGANDRVNVAIIGLGGRGRDHVREYLEVANCRIAALCDVNQAALERAQAMVRKSRDYTPTGYSDMRESLADKSIDAVSMPTPNHWHALGTIWACQAGKHVYVEKPACHNVWEGGKMIEAARRYNRVVQVGSQSRTTKHKIRAIQLLQEGVIGEVYLAKGICYKRRRSIGHKPDGPVPPGLNWDMFLGPAPMRPFNENRFAYNWHWFWDTGNGDIANQGVHEMDIARWGLGVGVPKSVVSTGGKFVYDDDQETPNTQLATFDYGAKQIVFEVRGLPTGEDSGIVRDGSGNVIGNVFYGSNGLLSVDMAGFRVFKGDKGEKVMEEKFAEKKT